MKTKTNEDAAQRRREKNPPQAHDDATPSEAQIDEALEESMGASEPPAHSVPVIPFNEDRKAR